MKQHFCMKKIILATCITIDLCNGQVFSDTKTGFSAAVFRS